MQPITNGLKTRNTHQAASDTALLGWLADAENAAVTLLTEAGVSAERGMSVLKALGYGQQARSCWQSGSFGWATAGTARCGAPSCVPMTCPSLPRTCRS